ncbi:MAG: hypothetical protein HamCj_21450 [Candidatus Hamiltonella defensa (Ceratovacuna japonica)]
MFKKIDIRFFAKTSTRNAENENKSLPKQGVKKSQIPFFFIEKLKTKLKGAML